MLNVLQRVFEKMEYNFKTCIEAGNVVDVRRSPFRVLMKRPSLISVKKQKSVA